jgi:hypothetical protein
MDYELFEQSKKHVTTISSIVALPNSYRRKMADGSAVLMKVFHKMTIDETRANAITQSYFVTKHTQVNLSPNRILVMPEPMYREHQEFWFMLIDNEPVDFTSSRLNSFGSMNQFRYLRNDEIFYIEPKPFLTTQIPLEFLYSQYASTVIDDFGLTKPPKGAIPSEG